MYSAQELAREQSGTREGKSPGFYIVNKTKWPVSIALEQVGCLYYGTIKPGEVFDRNTGAVWFTIRAKIQPDGKEERTDLKCAAPVAVIVGSTLVAAVIAGAVPFIAAPAVVAGSAAAALAPIVTSSAVIISSAVLGAGVEAAVKATGSAVGTALLDNSGVNLKGQYAGPEWPFRCDSKPTYEITGGWGDAAKDPEGNLILDKGTPLKITKTNSCGSSMMN